MWPFSKDNEVTKTKLVSVLTIRYKNGLIQSWAYHGKFKNYVHPWLSFYKWYFCRDKSEAYVIRSKGSETTVNKSDIFLFEVKEGRIEESND